MSGDYRVCLAHISLTCRKRPVSFRRHKGCSLLHSSWSYDCSHAHLNRSPSFVTSHLTILTSLPSSTWLPRFLSWTLLSLSSHEAQGDDVSVALEKLRDTYELAQEGSRSINQVGFGCSCLPFPSSHVLQRRSTMLFSPNARMSFPASAKNEGAVLALFADRIKLVSQLSGSRESPALQLLVALSALLSAEDYATLGPVLWKSFLTEDYGHSLASVSFFSILSSTYPEKMIDVFPDHAMRGEVARRHYGHHGGRYAKVSELALLLYGWH